MILVLSENGGVIRAKHPATTRCPAHTATPGAKPNTLRPGRILAKNTIVSSGTAGEDRVAATTSAWTRATGPK